MISFSKNNKKLLVVIVLAGVLAGDWPELVVGQNCGCPANICCSQFGYCGTSSDYCGQGCRAGPCGDDDDGNNGSSTSNNNNNNGTSAAAVISDIVTVAFFNGIKGKSDASCEGNKFYYTSSFLEAVESFPDFATVGTIDASKREIAAFFAHVSHETGNMCYIEDVDGGVYCDMTNQKYPCAPNKEYYGRGPLQLAWNYNYGAAGQAIGVDCLNSPELVATDAVISFKTALWFWMESGAHSAMVSGQGFGETVRSIGGARECDGQIPVTVNARRLDYYKAYCAQMDVNPGDNLECAKTTSITNTNTNTNSGVLYLSCY